MKGGVHIEDLDVETLGRLREQGISKPKACTFRVEEERQYAIKALYVLAGLKQGERARVLARAVRMNKA